MRDRKVRATFLWPQTMRDLQSMAPRHRLAKSKEGQSLRNMVVLPRILSQAQ